MEIRARLVKLEITASNPMASAAFYARAFAMRVEPLVSGFACQAEGRHLVFLPGEAGQLYAATLGFETRQAFETHRARLAARGVDIEHEDDSAYMVQDPEGRRVRFTAAAQAPRARGDAAFDALPQARLQHYAVRSNAPKALAAFYADALGFVVSDRVMDEQGALTAAFLRTDAEHHTMAIFRSREIRFDHFSCEVPDWTGVRNWADHMARLPVPLVWGVGRHGPGNDTFFMIQDGDGNMAEISAELEICAPDRPVGIWPHDPATLNQWGVAIMRS